MQNEELIVAHIKYAFGIVNAHRAQFADHERDDADSEALLALVIAGRRFDPAKSPAFAGWVGQRIAGALSDWAVSRKQRFGMSAQGRGRGIKIPRMARPFVQITDRNRGTETLRGRQTAVLLNESVAALPDRLADVIRMRYVEGERCHEIAQRIGVTQGRVSQMLKEAHGRLRGELARRGVRKVADIL